MPYLNFPFTEFT